MFPRALSTNCCGNNSIEHPFYLAMKWQGEKGNAQVQPYRPAWKWRIDEAYRATAAKLWSGASPPPDRCLQRCAHGRILYNLNIQISLIVKKSFHDNKESINIELLSLNKKNITRLSYLEYSWLPKTACLWQMVFLLLLPSRFCLSKLPSRASRVGDSSCPLTLLKYCPKWSSS